MIIRSLILALAGVVGLSQLAAARPLDDVTASGHLRVAVYRDFAPFASGPSDNVKGLDVELGKIIARRLGVKKVEYLVVTAGDTVADDLRNGVWKGHYLGYGVADVMLHIPVDKYLAVQNDNAYIFAPYYREQLVIAIDPRQTGGTDLIAAFGEHKVGVEGDSLADNYLLGAFGGRLRDNVVHFHSVAAAVNAMAQGKVAGVMGLRTQVEAALKKHHRHFRISSMPLPGLTVRSWLIGMAVKVDSHDLANAIEPIIETMARDGTLAKLFAKYGMTYIPPTED